MKKGKKPTLKKPTLIRTLLISHQIHFLSLLPAMFLAEHPTWRRALKYFKVCSSLCNSLVGPNNGPTDATATFNRSVGKNLFKRQFFLLLPDRVHSCLHLLFYMIAGRADRFTFIYMPSTKCSSQSGLRCKVQYMNKCIPIHEGFTI